MYTVTPPVRSGRTGRSCLCTRFATSNNRRGSLGNRQWPRTTSTAAPEGRADGRHGRQRVQTPKTCKKHVCETHDPAEIRAALMRGERAPSVRFGICSYSGRASVSGRIGTCLGEGTRIFCSACRTRRPLCRAPQYERARSPFDFARTQRRCYDPVTQTEAATFYPRRIAVAHEISTRFPQEAAQR